MTKKIQPLLVNTGAELTWKQQAMRSGIQMLVIMAGAVVVAGDYTEFMSKGPINVLWSPFWAGVVTTLGLYGAENLGTKV